MVTFNDLANAARTAFRTISDSAKQLSTEEALARQAPKQEGLMASSSRRLERAHELLDCDGVTVDDLMALTRDDEAICQVSTAPAHIESSGAAIMRPGTLDFWAVWGVPSHNDYVHVPFAAV